MKLTADELLTVRAGLQELVQKPFDDNDLAVEVALMTADVADAAEKIDEAAKSLRKQYASENPEDKQTPEQKKALLAALETLGEKKVEVKISKVSRAALQKAIKQPTQPLMWLRLAPILKT